MPTERSQPFQDGVGDGGPYSAVQWHLVLETLGLATGANVGVVPGILNELAVTSSGNNNITVNTGRAIPQGIVYENDASESKTTASPTTGTTGRRAVLRVDYSARTVRIAIISSSDGTASLPALTQTALVTWEIPLASFTITTGGVIGALTDEREWTTVPQPYSRYLARAGQTRYSIPGWAFDTMAAQSQSGQTDRILLTLIYLDRVMTFDRIAIEVTGVAGAGEKARLGVYAADQAADGLTPGALILDGGSALAIDATGTKEDTISLTLQPGYYFLAMVHDATGGSFNGPQDGEYITTPIVHPHSSLLLGGGAILQTDANAGADWANNGLPSPAPSVTDLALIEFANVFLRDST